MAQHLDRKTLKQDAFQDTMFDAVDWAYQRRVWIGAIVAAIVLAIAGGLGFRAYRDAQASDRTERFFQAEQVQSAPGASDAEAGARAREAYRAYIADYPDSELAPVAWMHVARLAWEAGETEEASTALQAVLDHGAATANQRDLAHIGLAKLAESQGDLAASEAQLRAVSDGAYEELKTLSLGRVAAAQQRFDEARQLYEKAARAAPGSPLGEWARQSLDYQP